METVYTAQHTLRAGVWAVKTVSQCDAILEQKKAISRMPKRREMVLKKLKFHAHGKTVWYIKFIKIMGMVLRCK